MRAWAATLAALVLAAFAPACDSAGRRPATTTTTVTDDPAGAEAVLLATVEVPELDESSGLVASRREPGLLWAHNDSGDGPHLYCLDRRGALCGAWSVTGARARDWEDMAAGPGPVAGQSYLYVGDIGDNRLNQASVTVYRLPEPVPAEGRGSAPARPRATAPAEGRRLRYADGPHDAEALLVHPVTADVYVVTKDAGRAGVYKAGDDGVLRRIASVALEEGETVTGGDIAPDGRRVVLCTYFGGLELSLPQDGDAFDRVWEQQPVLFDLGFRRQGESVAWRADGRAVLASSEGPSPPLFEVERPPNPRR